MEVMTEVQIAPCGMNCGTCVSYLAMKNDLKRKGYKRKYCVGCLPRGKNCIFIMTAGNAAELASKGRKIVDIPYRRAFKTYGFLNEKYPG